VCWVPLVSDISGNARGARGSDFDVAVSLDCRGTTDNPTGCLTWIVGSRERWGTDCL
jgi:hypothetical protein